mmetsp:Transcript_19552/g.23739  ORF Transcript_19552/g.23739 Transcript_19552/m.23739 type:complete len:200 (-) Transcript_19552:107-706(-)
MFWLQIMIVFEVTASLTLGGLRTKSPVIMSAQSEKEDTVTFIKCGNCGAAYPMTSADLPNGGSRVKCSVCGNIWYQTPDRLNNLFDGFDLEPFPESERERYQRPRPPAPVRRRGEGVSIFIANLAFEASEHDLIELFGSFVNGDLPPDATIVRAEDGRSKGFGFVTLSTDAEAQNAINSLNDTDLFGRTIVVRMGNKRN